MPRADKHKHTTEKTPALLLAKQLKLHFARKLCQEGLFPKRSRWLLAVDLAHQLNDVVNTIREANETKVVTLDEWGDRHRLLTSAVAKLKTFDAALDDAVYVLDINPDQLSETARLINELNAKLAAWIASDTKRYGSPPGLITEGRDR